MVQQIQARRGTATEWANANPVLAAGEPGFESDTKKFKWGDGSTAWSALAYAASEARAFFTAASQAAMLALSAAKKGDACLRTDLSPNQIFELTVTGYATLANWTAYPIGAAAWVRTADVTASRDITAADIGKILPVNSASAVVLSIPTVAVMSLGGNENKFAVDVVGAGAVTIVAKTGSTTVRKATALAIVQDGQYLVNQVGTSDTWVVS